MMERFGPKVHFLHLRNVKRDNDARAGSFFEAEHLEGDTDMVALIGAILREEERRRSTGRVDAQIPMRPDHGQEIVDDLVRGGQPGYPIVGRLRGLAELRGSIAPCPQRVLRPLRKAIRRRWMMQRHPRVVQFTNSYS